MGYETTMLVVEKSSGMTHATAQINELLHDLVVKEAKENFRTVAEHYRAIVFLWTAKKIIGEKHV